MNYLVITHHHELMPFANRLKSQGHQVDVIVWRKRYEKAWNGRLTKTLRMSEGQVNEESLSPWVQAANSGTGS